MPVRAFSIEDGNLGNRPIYSSVTRTYKDIDLTFAKKPSGDVYKKEDAAAVKQAIKNLLMTNESEKPFEPFYGGDLNRFLFDMSEGIDEIDIKDRIAAVINTFEPRAIVQSIVTDIKPDTNSILVKVFFSIINTTDILSLEISITRLR